MAKLKRYNSEAWLRLQYVINKKTIEQIASECGCSYNTIRTKLLEFSIIRK